MIFSYRNKKYDPYMISIIKILTEIKNKKLMKIV